MKMKNMDATIVIPVVMVVAYFKIVTLRNLRSFSSLLMEVSVQYRLYMSKTMICRLITTNSTVDRSINSAYTSN